MGRWPRDWHPRLMGHPAGPHSGSPAQRQRESPTIRESLLWLEAEGKEAPPGSGATLLACGCAASGDGCSVQHRRDWPGTDKGILEGGRLGNPGDSLCWLQDRAGASTPTASARGRVPVRLTPSAGKGRAGPSETNCRRPPVRRGQVWGLGGQSSEPHLACPVVATAAVLVGTWWQVGCERAAPGRPPARSHPSSASPTGQLRMWTIYTGRGGRAAAETGGPGAICGHDRWHAGLPGGRGPKTASVLGAFQVHKVPADPPAP